VSDKLQKAMRLIM